MFPPGRRVGRLASGIHHHVVDVDVDVAANLARKALPHAPLVGRPGVLETEGHGGVAEGSEWRDERRLLLVSTAILIWLYPE